MTGYGAGALRSLGIDGCLILAHAVAGDERGSFSRIVDQADLDRIPEGFRPEQWSLSGNLSAGTLRGIHFQFPPHAESKLVSCVSGRLFDVVVDLRPGSPTLGHASHVELSAGDGLTLLVPPGVAHGFLTLVDATALVYGIAPSYEPGHGSGIRWNDPALDVPWPMTPRQVSERDAALPDLKDVIEAIAARSRTDHIDP